MEQENQVMGDITQLLDNLIYEKWRETLEALSRGDYNAAYHCLEGIFLTINEAHFEGKKEIETISKQTEQLVIKLTSNDKSTEKKIKNYYEDLSILKVQIKIYANKLSSACQKLGKWIRIYPRADDYQKELSEKTFGTEETLIEQEIKELSKLDNKTMLSYFNKNSIHNAYIRRMIELANP